MTVNELILIDSGKVRRSPDLMAFYIETFMAVFNYKPNCAGCTFDSDFRKLKSHFHGSTKTILQTTKFNKMATFKLKKKQGKIFSFNKDNRTYRAYDTNFTDTFVNGFLTYGTKAEIAERKNLFSELPEKFQDKPKAVAEVKSETSEKPKAKAQSKKTSKETDKK